MHLHRKGIHRARGYCVTIYHLAKLLCHHRLLCRGADWIDVRGDHVDLGGSCAKVEWTVRGIRLANSRAFLHRAPRRRDSQRAMASTLECWPTARPCRSRGVTYVVIVVRRARKQTDYQLVLEDWLWHTVFPLVSYTALLFAAIVLPGNPAPALFVIGATTVLLLSTGIHNAWDTVTYIVIELPGPEK